MPRRHRVHDDERNTHQDRRIADSIETAGDLRQPRREHGQLDSDRCYDEEDPTAAHHVGAEPHEEKSDDDGRGREDRSLLQ